MRATHPASDATAIPPRGRRFHIPTSLRRNGIPRYSGARPAAEHPRHDRGNSPCRSREPCACPPPPNVGTPTGGGGTRSGRAATAPVSRSPHGPTAPGSTLPPGPALPRAPRGARVHVAGSGARSVAARLTPEVHVGVERRRRGKERKGKSRTRGKER